MNLRPLALVSIALGVRLSPVASADLAERLEAERLEQSGTVISILFDDSGSMEGAKLAQAKAAFTQWIATVPATHRLGLTALNAGELVPVGRDNRPALLAAVSRLKATRGTPLAVNIRSALAKIELRRRDVGPYERHILLVFTDGQDTSGEGPTGVQRELARASAASVETIGIGYHGEGAYMRSAATHFYEARNASELSKSLGKVDAEIGDTSDVVIDEPIRRAMEGGSSPGTVQVAFSPPMAEPEAPKPAKKRHGSHTATWVVVFMILLMAARASKRVKKH